MLNVMKLFYHIRRLCRMSTMPVPVRIGRPVTILADGESSVSERPFMAASVKNVMVVSKLICKKGELLFYRAVATKGGA